MNIVHYHDRKHEQPQRNKVINCADSREEKYANNRENKVHRSND